MFNFSEIVSWIQWNLSKLWRPLPHKVPNEITFNITKNTHTHTSSVHLDFNLNLTLQRKLLTSAIKTNFLIFRLAPIKIIHTNTTFQKRKKKKQSHRIIPWALLWTCSILSSLCVCRFGFSESSATLITKWFIRVFITWIIPFREKMMMKMKMRETTKNNNNKH